MSSEVGRLPAGTYTATVTIFELFKVSKFELLD
jgi:hypothetical protein